VNQLPINARGMGMRTTKGTADVFRRLLRRGLVTAPRSQGDTAGQTGPRRTAPNPVRALLSQPFLLWFSIIRN
jgi:hypothetical protein